MDCRLMHLKKFRQGNLRKLGGEGGGRSLAKAAAQLGATLSPKQAALLLPAPLHPWVPPRSMGWHRSEKGSFLRQCRADQAEGASWSHQGSQSPVLPAMRCERWGWAWPWFSGSSTSKMKGSFTHMMLHMKVSTKRGLNDVWRLQ